MPAAIEFIQEPEIGIDPLTVATASLEGYSSDEIAPFRLRKQDIEDLIIKVQGFGSKGRARSQSIMGNVTECMIEDSIDQPNSVVVTVHDPDWDLLNSGALEFPVDINPGKLPHRWYRLDSYNVNDDDITLTFIVRNAIYLAGHKRPYSISRNKVTRAQFILTLLHHVKKTDIKLYCPQLKKKQKIAKFASDTERKNARNRGSGFTASDKITVKGGAANALQKDHISKVIQAGIDSPLNPPGLVIVSAVMCIIQESNAGTNTTRPNSPYIGDFQQNPKWWMATGDPYKDAKGVGNPSRKSYYEAATPAFNENPDIDLGEFVANVQGVTGSTDPRNAGYAMSTNRWRAEAQHAVNAFGGIDVNDPGSSTTTTQRRESYHYGVGVEPYGTVGENYLAAVHRLADEVQWAAFWVKDVLHYQEYDELFAAKARVRVRRNNRGVEGVSFSYDRMKKVDKMTLKVRMDLWVAPCGTVVIFDEGDDNVRGRWLITNIRRSIFDELGEIELSKPKNSKLEKPANEVSVTSRQQPAGAGQIPGEEGADIDGLKSICQVISNEKHGYLLGGGHPKKLKDILRGGTSAGVEPLDCSSSVSLALWEAKMFPGEQAIVSGEFARSWGKPGRGKEFTVWANADHVFLQGEGLYNHWRFDTSMQIDDDNVERGPRVRNNWRRTEGFTPRHWEGH
jgi:hypothetical protein